MVGRFASFVVTLFALGTALAATSSTSHARSSAAAGYIVEAQNSASATKAVQGVGGRVTRELPIVNGVAARLTPSQVARLRSNATLTLFADAPVIPQGGKALIDQYDRTMVGADKLAAQGFLGTGVTVAVLDSGVWYSYVNQDLNANNRILAIYDAIYGLMADAGDIYGHGTHIASIIGSADTTLNGQPMGIAPMAKLVIVRGFDSNGTGSYASVPTGLNWILANRATYNIRVLNLSFGAKPQSFYWNDPIDQAVMKLWQAGVVVVTSAGNFGPAAQTIAVPGNTPYAITVGAMTDNWTPTNTADDGIASFSSTGPTYEGFVKPDIVAPGGHLVGSMNHQTTIAKQNPSFASADGTFYVVSGTSQAAAVTSGVVALMLQANPALTPDQVKCRLMASASAAVNSGGKAAYTIFQQG
jgi:serine protease AprX